ncbi:uncharacterized protein A4U43_C08F8030 [Asparagus officinalis]|nr:uncharacterized protein A4U43_C08F8030 [Asparagus officinalis]
MKRKDDLLPTPPLAAMKSKGLLPTPPPVVDKLLAVLCSTGREGYAGFGSTLSPPPSCLPLPSSFFLRKPADVETIRNEIATKRLLRLLGIDDRRDGGLLKPDGFESIVLCV